MECRLKYPPDDEGSRRAEVCRNIKGVVYANSEAGGVVADKLHSPPARWLIRTRGRFDNTAEFMQLNSPPRVRNKPVFIGERARADRVVARCSVRARQIFRRTAGFPDYGDRISKANRCVDRPRYTSRTGQDLAGRYCAIPARRDSDSREIEFDQNRGTSW